MNVIQSIQFGISAMGEQKNMRGEYQVVETMRIASRLESEAAIMVAFLSKSVYPVQSGHADIDQAVQVLRDYYSQFMSDSSIQLCDYPLAQQVEMARLQLMVETTTDEAQREVYIALLKNVEAKPEDVNPLELALMKLVDDQIDPLLETSRDLERFAHQYEAFLGIQLTEEQLEAIETALTEKLTVIYGAPGTGRLVTMDALMKAATTLDGHIKLHVISGGSSKQLTILSNRYKRPVYDLTMAVPDQALVLIHDGEQFNQQVLASFIESLPVDARLVFTSSDSTFTSNMVVGVSCVALTKVLRQTADIQQNAQLGEGTNKELFTEEEVDENGGRQLRLTDHDLGEVTGREEADSVHQSLKLVTGSPLSLEDDLTKLRKEEWDRRTDENEAFVSSALIATYESQYESKRGIQLSGGQSKALYEFFNEPVYAISGKKGSGVTECAKLLVDSLSLHKGGLRIQVFTPDDRNSYLTKRLDVEATPAEELTEQDLYVIENPDSFDPEALKLLIHDLAHHVSSGKTVLFVGQNQSPLLTQWYQAGIVPGERL